MCALLLHKSMDLRRLIVAGTKCFPSRARARSQIIAEALRGLSLSLQCSGFGFLGQTFGAQPCCPSRNQLHSPKGQGVEQSPMGTQQRIALDLVNPPGGAAGPEAWRSSCWGALARWRSSFLDSGHTEKVWSRCLCLSSNQYPPHVSTTQPFFPNSHWPYLGPQPAIALVRAKEEVLGLQRLAHAAHRAMVAP